MTDHNVLIQTFCIMFGYIIILPPNMTKILKKAIDVGSILSNILSHRLVYRLDEGSGRRNLAVFLI